MAATTSRNAPCPCGSGKKYKLCCLPRQTALQAAPAGDSLLREALLLHRRGDLLQATAIYQQVLAYEPNNPDALHLLGVAAAAQGRPDLAVQYVAQAIALRGTEPDYHKNLSTALRALGDLTAAAGCLREAVQMCPHDGSLHRLLGQALGELGNWQAAEEAYRIAARLDPGDGPALRGLADALALRDDQTGAIAVYQAASALLPDDLDIWNNLGMALLKIGRLAEAAHAFQEVLRRKPDAAGVRVSLAYALQALCAWRDLPQHWCAIRAAVASNPRVLVAPFLFLTGDTTAAEQLACARHWTVNAYAPLAGTQPVSSSTHRGTAMAPLHLGYLSADFREHPVAALMVELLERHERQRVEVSAYSIGPDDGSAMRGRVVRAVDHFVDLAGLSHAAAAARIAADGVEVLVDLNGYTALSRPQILALRAAPVQVNYLGYPGTMGAPFMDYIIADRFIIPEEQVAHYSERVAYLPECYQPNDRQRVLAAGVPSRAACGLPEEGVVYCCFNRAYKITAAVFAVWMRVLAAVPGSVLWLLGTNEQAKENLRWEAAAAGIAPERLVFALRLGPAEHLARHRVADLFLDTVPVNAHTTCSDALWAGLPVLTCVGETFVSRVAGSLLRAVGLPELVTESLEEYEALAVGLGRDPARLGELRARLWVQRETAVLFDSGRTARGLEGLYERMWAEYCRTGLGDGGSRTPLRV